GTGGARARAGPGLHRGGGPRTHGGNHVRVDRIGGAPISWGVCEAPGWGHELPPDLVLGEMRALGLRATELGPTGYLGQRPEDVRARLGRYGLRLLGGFLP